MNDTVIVILIWLFIAGSTLLLTIPWLYGSRRNVRALKEIGVPTAPPPFNASDNYKLLLENAKNQVVTGWIRLASSVLNVFLGLFLLFTHPVAKGLTVAGYTTVGVLIAFVLMNLIQAGRDLRERSRLEALFRLRDEERNHLRAVLELSEESIIGETLTGVITAWNAGATKLYGYTEKEMVGQDMSMLIPSGRKTELADILARAARGESVPRFETQRRTKDGTIIPVSVAVTPIRDARGEVVGACSGTQRLGENIAGNPAAIMMDQDGRIIGWSAEAERLFGWTSAEVEGRDLADTIIPERYRSAHRAGLVAFGATGHAPVLGRVLRLWGLRRDGSEFPAELSITPPMLSAGRIIFTGFVGDLNAA